MTRQRWMALCFALGSTCFFIEAFPGYANLRHRWHGWLPVRGGTGWWQPAVNLLGCIFFGISAVAGYVVPSTGSMLSQAACNWNTALGAACFLLCAVDSLVHSRDRDRAESPSTPRTEARPGAQAPAGHVET